MDKNFWIGLLVGILIVVVGLVLFGDNIDAPAPDEEQIRSLNQQDESASSTEDVKDTTIWNEFDGEIGI